MQTPPTRASLSTSTSIQMASHSTSAIFGERNTSVDCHACKQPVSRRPSTDAHAPDDSAALIGGIVGSVVALLLFCGLTAFVLARTRRNVNHDDNINGVASTSVASAPSNYGRIPTRPKNESRMSQQANGDVVYDDVSYVRSMEI
jgi:hypothetical protein